MITAPCIILDSRDFSDDEFWKDVAKITQLLTKYNYDVKISYEDCGIYSIEYVSSDLNLGDVRFEVVTAEESEMLYDSRTAH